MRAGLSVWALVAAMLLNLTIAGFCEDSSGKKDEKAPDAPADVPKHAASFDLPIALGLLAASPIWRDARSAGKSERNCKCAPVLGWSSPSR